MQIAERREINTSINNTTINPQKDENLSFEDERESFLEPDSNVRKDIYAPANPSTSSVDPLEYQSLDNFLASASKQYDVDTSKSGINLPSKSYLDSNSKNKLQGTPVERATTYVLPPFVSDMSTIRTKSEDTSASTLHVKNVVDIPITEDVKSPPLAGPNVMNIILVAAECTPWSKTGTTSNFRLG